MLDFLNVFRDTRDTIVVHEGVAMWFPHFLKKPASGLLSIRQSSKNSNSSGLRDTRPPSYIEVVNFQLATYATDEVIACTVKYLENYKQALDVTPT